MGSLRTAQWISRIGLTSFYMLWRVAAQAPGAAPALEPGEPLEKELAGGQSHEHQLRLEANQYLHAIVEQRGIDVVVSVFDPDGRKLAEVDSPNGASGPEPVYLVAPTAGAYHLRVASLEKNAPRGKYEVRIVDRRPATEQDKARIAALAAVAEGDALEARGEADSLRKAIPVWERAVRLLRVAGDRDREADTLLQIGFAHKRLGEGQKALESYEQALPIVREAGDRRGEATVLNNIGGVHHASGRNQQALSYYEQALPLLRASGYRFGEGRTLNSIASVYADLGENQDALESFQRALSIAREVDDRRGESAAFDGIGFLYRAQGEYQKALEQHQQGLLVAKAAKSRSDEAYSLVNIGMVYSSLGEKRKALEYYQQALPTMREIGDRRAEAVTMNNIGLAYQEMEEAEEALEYYRQALPLRKAVGDRSGEATTLNNIAGLYKDRREFEKALDYYQQALPLRRAVGDRDGEALTLSNIGRVYRGLGDRQRAFDSFQQALSLAQAVGDREHEAGVRFDLAVLEEGRGNLVQARSYYESGLAIRDSLRSAIANPELRASYFAARQDAYAGYIGLLLRQDKAEPFADVKALAFEAAEKGRARSTLEMLREAHADIRQGVDPALLQRERSLTGRFAALASRQVRLLSGRHTEEQAASIQKEAGALETELQQVQAAIRKDSPRYAALMHPQAATLREIQDGVLDRSTVLLEYSLGRNVSYLFAVTPDSIQTFELAGQPQIDRAARRVYELLTARNRRKGETETLRMARVAEAARDYPGAASALSKMVLGPAAAVLKGKRLLVVAEGALQYIPFCALPDPVSTAPLVVGHEVVSVPSATVLAAVRREAAQRKPAPRLVAVLADPVFDARDPRVAGGRNGAASVVRDIVLNRSAADTRMAEDGLRLPRLLFTRDEADAIARLAPSGLKALDFHANLATARGKELSSYRMVHFATHGLLNEEHPGLSGLVLSLVDVNGQARDGYLALSDVYNLNLRADLVVLSACQTGLGKDVRGEGLVGLVRGFMYAGAPRVVASMWKVDDVATAQFMERFYRAMLQDKQPPAAALRSAQISLWKQGRWSSPYYWAAFVMHGEWR